MELIIWHPDGTFIASFDICQITSALSACATHHVIVL